MIHDGPTKILVSADAQSGRDMAKIFGSLLLEAAKIYAYRSVTENIFGSISKPWVEYDILHSAV